MLLRLCAKALALLIFFFMHYTLYSIFVVLIVEVWHASPLPLAFPWSLAALVSLGLSALIAVATYRGIRRLARRGDPSIARS